MRTEEMNSVKNEVAKAKGRRQRLPEIIDLLTNSVITSQEDLARQLAFRGHETTQATLSRDLKLLKATKIADARGGYRYVLGQNGDEPGERMHQRSALDNSASVLSVARTGNLIVIKTRNGYASGLAYDIDMLGSALVLGTVSGADTVFLAIEERTDPESLRALLTTFVPADVMAKAKI